MSEAKKSAVGSATERHPPSNRGKAVIAFAIIEAIVLVSLLAYAGFR